jgi:formylglycine-generating enzyme required for sulfatase activity
MRLNLIPAGIFLMGSPEGEQDRADCEALHEVEITRPFYLGVYEVTQAEYETIMTYNPSTFSPQRLGAPRKGVDTRRLPVERVSWDDAVTFCNKLSELPEEKKARRVYRLPTEAEWEYASRGGSQVSAPFSVAGKPSFTLSSFQSNFDGSLPYGGVQQGRGRIGPTTVGSYPPNGFGLYDMHGNVWEWCADWYWEDYYKHSLRKDPKGPKEGLLRVARGGSFLEAGVMCRSAARYNAPPLWQWVDIGFRVVCEVEPGGR